MNLKVMDIQVATKAHRVPIKDAMRILESANKDFPNADVDLIIYWSTARAKLERERRTKKSTS